MSPCLGTHVCEAKKVERLRTTFATSFSGVDRIATELDQTRFLWMELQTELGKALVEFFQTRLCLVCDAQSRSQSRPRSGLRQRHLGSGSSATTQSTGQTHSARTHSPAAVKSPPLGVFPTFVFDHSPSSLTPAVSHLRISRRMRLSPMRCSRNFINHSWSMRVEEAFDVGVQYPIHSFAGEADRQRIECVVTTPTRSKAIAETEKVLLVDALEHPEHRLLDDLVLQRRDAQRSLPTVGLGYPDSARRFRSVGSPVNTIVEVRNVGLQVRLVFMPCYLVNSNGCRSLQLIEAFGEAVFINVVQQRP